jgi:hypothetical protein
MTRLIEIRAYQLRADTRDAFHELMAHTVVPMLIEARTDVIAFGPSAHDVNAYFLIRAYNDLEDLNRQQDSFYGSDQWRQGPHEALISRIENYLNTVLWLSDSAIQDLRERNQQA